MKSNRRFLMDNVILKLNENWFEYRGVKHVYATPMTLGEYNKYRGWDIPENEDPNKSGYLVEYTDGGPPNYPEHRGYVSWSPAEVFANSYQRSGTPKDRLRVEQAELLERISKAQAFINKGKPAFMTNEAWGLLLDQVAIQNQEYEILCKRYKLM